MQKYARFTRLLYKLIAVYIVVAAILWAGQDLLLFPPLGGKVFMTLQSITPPSGVESFFIETEDGEQLEVWTTWNANMASTPPEYVGIIFHGNGETVAQGNYLPFFKRHRIPAFTIDYRGYGRSSGWPSEEKLRLDSLSYWEAIRAKTGVSADHAIVLGNSIGSGPASFLAAQINPRVVILIAGFSSLDQVIEDIPLYRPFRWLLRYQFPNSHYLASLKSECVILAQGKRDQVINYRHLGLLSESADHVGVRKVVVLSSEVASHNDIYYAVEEQLDRELDRCLAGTGS